jgi:hypothetical protein
MKKASNLPASSFWAKRLRWPKLKLASGIGAGIAPGAGVDADRAHEGAEMKLAQDHEIADRDVARAGQHEMHRLGHLFRLDQAASGALRFELFRRPVGDQRGHDGPGQDGPDTQAVRDDLTSDGVNEGLHRVFGGRVDRFPHHGDDACNRTRDDDVAGLARDHMRQDSVNAAEGRVDVEVQHAVPGVGVAIADGAADIGAGIGVEDVELAGLRENLRHHAGDRCGIGQIDGERDRVRSEGPHIRASAASSRSTRTTRAPAASRRFAQASPIPEAAPVIAATFPASSCVTW